MRNLNLSPRTEKHKSDNFNIGLSDSLSDLEAAVICRGYIQQKNNLSENDKKIFTGLLSYLYSLKEPQKEVLEVIEYLKKKGVQNEFIALEPEKPEERLYYLAEGYLNGNINYTDYLSKLTRALIDEIYVPQRGTLSKDEQEIFDNLLSDLLKGVDNPQERVIVAKEKLIEHGFYPSVSKQYRVVFKSPL